MRSSFLGFETSKNSIQVSQKALDITGNNMSNLKTQGYTRQRVDTSSVYLSSYNNYTTRIARLAISGQGVTANGVAQCRDEYIDKRYRETTCYVGEYDTLKSTLGEVETALDNYENSGLADLMDTFKQALQTSATDAADNDEICSIVRNAAYNITTMLQTNYSELNNIESTTLYNLTASVDDVNNLISKVVEYNKAIVKEYNVSAADKIYNGESVIGSYGPNELLDARNLLIDDLSYYGNIHVENNNDGSVKVTMGETTIIDGEKSLNMVLKDYEEYGAAVMCFSNGDDLNLTSGEIKAYQAILNGNGPYSSYYQSSEYGIPYYKSTLDAFAQTFSQVMNQANGCTETDTSRALFASSNDTYDEDGNCTYRGTITASNIRISNEWMKDETMIGEVYNEETGEYTLDLDGTSLNKFTLALQEDVNVGRANDYNGSIYDFISFYSNRLGQQLSYIDEQYDSFSTTANELLDSRDAISGVSDTEEGINMLTYQKWFNASSRMMTTLDDCLDKIINSMGRVGL